MTAAHHEVMQLYVLYATAALRPLLMSNSRRTGLPGTDLCLGRGEHQIVVGKRRSPALRIGGKRAMFAAAASVLVDASTTLTL